MQSRERTARVLGIVVSAGAMTCAWLAVGWPAPGVSVLLGLVVYAWVRAPASDGKTTG